MGSDVINVGDLVNFGETEGYEYEVTGDENTTSGAETITIKLKDDPNGQGLQSTISSGTNIRRRWRFYDLFDGAPSAHLHGLHRMVEELLTSYTLLFMTQLEI